MIGVLEIVVVSLVAIGFGLIVWASDRKHAKYGASLPVGVAIVSAMLTWIAAAAAGLRYAPGWVWVPWIAPLIVALAVSFTVSLLLSRSREKRDTARMTVILKQH